MFLENMATKEGLLQIFFPLGNPMKYYDVNNVLENSGILKAFDCKKTYYSKSN